MNAFPRLTELGLVTLTRPPIPTKGRWRRLTDEERRVNQLATYQRYNAKRGIAK